MALESPVTYISDLVSSNPTVSDPRNEGDDHIRNVKAAVKATFPNITGAVTATQAELNILDGATLTTTELNYVDGVTSAIQTQLDAKAALASPTFSGNVGIGTAGVGGYSLTCSGSGSFAGYTRCIVSGGGIFDVVDTTNTGASSFRALDSGGYIADLTFYSSSHATLAGKFKINSSAGGNIQVGGSDSISVSSNRNVTVNAPSSGGHTITGELNFGVAGTEWDIDASNRLINPGNTQPKFRANRTTNQTSGSTIVFDDESTAANKNCDHGGNYNASTGIFTAPVAGYYVFEFSGVFANSTGSSYVQYCTIVADSVNIGQSTHVDIPNGQSRGVSVSAGAYLDANDQVSILSNNTFTASNYLLAGTNAAFSGRLVC